MDAETLQRENIPFDAEGGFSPEEYELGSGEAPPTAHFPIIIFGFAVMKDFIIDPTLAGVELTGVGALVAGGLGLAINFVFVLTIFFWMLGKLSFIQKRMIRWLIRRAIFAGLLGTVPVISLIVPEATILVLIAHNKEKAIVKLFLAGLEKIEGSVK